MYPGNENLHYEQLGARPRTPRNMALYFHNRSYHQEGYDSRRPYDQPHGAPIVMNELLKFKHEVLSSKDSFQAEAAYVLRIHHMKVLEAKARAREMRNAGSGGDMALQLSLAESKIAELERQQIVFEKNMAEYLVVYDSLLRTEEIADIEHARAQHGALWFKLTFEIQQLTESLPMYAFKEELITVVKQNPVTIVLAETGSGKSTSLPQFMYQAGFGETGMIACTQPRKFAAASLAKYVSNCARAEEGSLVASSSGYSSRLSPSTKILYATDVTLLRNLPQDAMLTSYSVVIVDEAHERTISTDVLLGMLKKILAERKDLKVIISSATIDPEPLVEYFNNAPIFEVRGRIFPVEIRWLPEEYLTYPETSCVQKAVEVAVEVHKTEAPGDILCFLPSPAEINLAVDMLNRKKLRDIWAFELHGRMQVEDQMQIFEPAPAEIRKIVFATNVAETSVTIPGIVYVIDSGLAKELVYNEVKNIGRLEVCRISRSSAEQRKGRAGRTGPGKCFRMFTEAGYAEMRACVLPEILRTHLGQAILTLMHAGVKDPLAFDFVTAPKLAAFEEAFKSLAHLGAVVKNDPGGYTLTEFGEVMQRLPVDPRFGRMILRGLEENIGFEAAMVAALGSGCPVFYRSGTEKEKQQVDMKSLRFSLPEGDFITMLNVYKIWQEQPSRRRAAFCKDNGLNNKTLETARKLFLEIQNDVQEVKRHRIAEKFSNDQEEVRKKLVRLIAECFSENICIYSGLDAAGYVSVVRGAQVWPHPGSTLNKLEKPKPKYFVFESVLTTSADWALSITPISRSLLQEMQPTGLFPSLEQLDECCFSHCRIIQPVGALTMKKRILGKRAELLTTFIAKWSKRLGSPNLNVTAEVALGRVIITCFGDDNALAVLDQVEGALRAIIDDEVNATMKRTLDERFDGGSQCRIGAGFLFTDIIRFGDYRQVNVISTRNGITEEYIKELFAEQSDYIERIVREAGGTDLGSKFKIFFNSAVVAERIIKHPPAGVTDSDDLKIQPGPRNSHQRFSMTIKWARRKNRGFGFVSFGSIDDRDAAWSRFNSGNMMLRGSRFDVTTKLGNRELEIYCRSLPTDLMLDEFKDFLLAEKISHVNCTLAYEDKTETTPENIRQYREAFTRLLPNMEGFQMRQVRPETADFTANASFARAEHLREAIETINGTLNPVDGTRMRARSSSNLKFTAGEEVVVRVEPFLEPFLDELKAQLGSRAADLKVTKDVGGYRQNRNQRRGKRVTYTVKSGDFAIAVEAHLRLTELFQGLALQLDDGDKAWERVLCTVGGVEHLLAYIHDKLPCTTLHNEKQKSILLFGTKKTLDDAKDEIQRYKEKPDEAGTIRTYRVPVEVGKVRGMQRLIRLGSELQQIKETVGAKSVVLDKRSRAVEIIGTVEAYYAAREEIDRIIQAAGQDDAGATEDKDDEDHQQCPICLEVLSFNSASNGATNRLGTFYRLEACGHAYCSECVKEMITWTELPLVCAVQDCEKPLSAYEFEVFVLENSNSDDLKNRIISAAAEELVTRSAAQQDLFVVYIHCPTADCNMILRSLRDSWDTYGPLENCPMCLNDACVKCGVGYHHGISCELHHIIHSDGDIQAWLARDPANHRLCPSCSAPIEKNGGCNHVQCTKCKTHFCFPCRLSFFTQDAVYAHLHQIHP